MFTPGARGSPLIVALKMLAWTALLLLPVAVGAETSDSQCGWDTHMSDSLRSSKSSRRLIDISVAIQPNLPSWDKAEGLGRHRELIQRRDEGGVAFVSKVDLVVHTATHFDAPSHFLQEAFDSGRGIEALDLSIMNGDLVAWHTYIQLFKHLSTSRSLNPHISLMQDLFLLLAFLTT